MNYVFIVPLRPVAKGRPRFTRTGHAYTPKATADYEQAVAAYARRAMAEIGEKKATGAVNVWLTFYYAPPKSWTKAQQLKCAEAGSLPKTTKPDVDNLVKAVLDGMNGIVFEDDNQIAGIYATKAWSYDRADSVSIGIFDGEK